MGCRVGITTNVEETKRIWEEYYGGLKTFNSRGPFSRKEAQELEINIKLKFLCDGEGDFSNLSEKEDSWFVYYLEY